MCLKTNIKFKELYLKDITESDDACGITITIKNKTIAIFSIYSLPKDPLNDALFSRIMTQKQFIIVGDLNAKNKLWHCKEENKYGRELESLINHHNIQILNNDSITYPRGKSILDLTLTSNCLNRYQHTFSVLNDSISDHKPTLTTIHNLEYEKKKTTFKKTNWEKYTNILSTTDRDNPPIASEIDLERAATNLTTTIQKALAESTSKITIKSKPKTIMSIPSELLKLIKLKRRTNRMLSKNNSTDLRKIYNALQKKIKTSIAKLKTENLKTNFLQLEQFKSSTAKHWKVLNALTDSGQNKRTQSYFQGTSKVIDNETEIAESFALHLNDIFGVPTQINFTTQLQNLTQNSISTTEDHTYFTTSITLDEIKNSLSSCKASGAPGADKITNNMLKLCPPNVLKRIQTIFNASLNLGYLPTAWKFSNVKMIHKRNKPKDYFNSYRPISLISCISKLLEKVINARILNWAETTNNLPPCQSGFRKNKSCQDHIARLDQIITEGFNNKQITGCILFDLEKAFDKASHEGILFKLTKAGLPTLLLNWVKNFLLDRTFHVTWRQSISTTFTTKTGVPQGSCLSPTLFNLFFSDISDSIPSNIHRALYADDLAILYSSSTTREISSNLQTAVNQITSFCNNWGLKINKSKTTYTVFTPAGKRKNYERTYKLNVTIDNIQIPIEPFPTLLGIKLDPSYDCKPS